MKQLSRLFIAALALMFVFASCEKEGVFNPKKKISEIYKSSSYSYDGETYNTPKYLSERWNWDGKILKSVDYYDNDGSLDYSETYTYDKNRLTKVSWGSTSYYELVYDKNKLSSINYYYSGTLSETLKAKHDGSKIVGFEYTGYDAKGAMARVPASAFRFILPAANVEDIAKAFAKISEKAVTKDIETYNIDFVWDGNNISEVKYTEGAYIYSIEYEYDSKINPFYGLFDISEIDVTTIMSKNNITKFMEIEDGETYIENFEYEYDGNVPVKRINRYSSEGYSSVSITEYEYK